MMVVSNESENREILYSDGWFDEEKDQTGPWRWMTNHSTLLVYSDHEQNKTIQFDASSFGRPYNLNLQTEGNNYVYDIHPENYSTITSPLHLYAGYNLLQYNVLQGCTRPSDSSGLNNSDTRCLSLNIRNISLIEQLPVKNATENREILYSDGWYNEEKDQTGSWRWMTNHSTLLVYSDHEQNKTIQFDASSFGRPYNLNLDVDGTNYLYEVDPQRYSVITSPLHLHAGYTTVQFNALEGCICPCNIPGPFQDDTRCLSINVRNMTIS